MKDRGEQKTRCGSAAPTAAANGRRPGDHAYICECPDRRCHRRLFLTPTRFTEIAVAGPVVSAECAARDRRRVLFDLGAAVVVKGQK